MTRLSEALAEIDEWFERQSVRGGSMEVHNQPMYHTEFDDIFLEGLRRFTKLKKAELDAGFVS